MIKKIKLTKEKHLQLTRTIDKRIAQLETDITFASKSDLAKKLHRQEMNLWREIFHQLFK